MINKNLDGKTKEQFALGIKSNKVTILPDRIRKKLGVTDDNGIRWTCTVDGGQIHLTVICARIDMELTGCRDAIRG